MDMATTGFDNLIFKYWELYEHYGWLCKDVYYSVRNTNTEAVLAAIEFRDRHDLQENEMIIDVQGFGFLSDCFPRALHFSGAGSASNRGKQQFKTMKDEAGHVAMEMIQAGLIHYDPSLANKHYYHQNMKRTGGTTIMRHLVFESKIFQFYRTPNGRIAMLEKEKMKQLLKGMSPDLTDNVILLCGGTIYDCHRMLREDAGVSRKRMQAEDMLSVLNIDGQNTQNVYEQERKRIKNATEILDIISNI